MSGAEAQAAGVAVGAAVGAVAGAGNPAAIAAGASVGGGLGTAVGGFLNNKTQTKLERETLKLNQEQAHARAADQSARHAANFRQALASQVSLANMRGGSGSIASQFGVHAMQSFVQDQQAIEAGVRLADTQAVIGQADITARSEAGNIRAAGTAISAFDALDFNKLSNKKAALKAT